MVLSPEAFDELAAKAELAESLKMLEASMVDIREGRTKELKPALRELAESLGLKLEVRAL